MKYSNGAKLIISLILNYYAIKHIVHGCSKVHKYFDQINSIYI